MSCGLEEIDHVDERIDLAGDPQSAIVWVTKLFFRKPEEFLEQRVGQEISIHL